MEDVLALLIGVVLEWIALLIVVPFAARLTGFSMPSLPQFAWKMGVIVVVAIAVSTVLGLTGVPLLPRLGSIVVFWLFMSRWFDAGLFDVFIVLVIDFLFWIFVGAAIAMALA